MFSLKMAIENAPDFWYYADDIYCYGIDVHQGDFLKQEFESRRTNRPRYSMRAFARDLEMSPSFLSRVLAGKKTLAEARALAIANALKWSTPQTDYFLAHVRIAQAKSDAERIAAEKQLAKVSDENPEYQSLGIDIFRAISRWYHGAILELLSCEDFVASRRAFSRRLRISEIEVELAIDRLKRLGLIQIIDGKMVSGAPRFSNDDIPNGAYQAYHREMLLVAGTALSEQPPEVRDFSNVTFAFNSERIEEAREMIMDFRRRFVEVFGKTRLNSVYQLSVQFFRLDRKESAGPSKIFLH